MHRAARIRSAGVHRSGLGKRASRNGNGLGKLLQELSQRRLPTPLCLGPGCEPLFVFATSLAVAPTIWVRWSLSPMSAQAMVGIRLCMWGSMHNNICDRCLLLRCFGFAVPLSKRVDPRTLIRILVVFALVPFFVVCLEPPFAFAPSHMKPFEELEIKIALV